MISLKTFLADLEFNYTITADNKLMLIDELGANLGGIEQEEFEIYSGLPIALVDRLDTYIFDYHISGIRDTLQECGYTDDIYPYDEKLIPAMKQYPNEFDEELINYIQDIINANIDISELTKTNYDLICPYCKHINEESNFPDLFYEDSSNDLYLKQQYQNLKELQAIGYNIVTCGDCGQVFIQKL